MCNDFIERVSYYWDFANTKSLLPGKFFKIWLTGYFAFSRQSKSTRRLRFFEGVRVDGGETNLNYTYFINSIFT